MPKIYIGVGHGGKDPGAIGRIKEAAANLIIALAMRNELVRHEITVELSRSTDEDDTLEEEIREANACKPDIAVDIHSNAGGGDGFEAFVQTGKYEAMSRALAASIEENVKALGQRSRGIKTKKNAAGIDYYGFLRRVKAPAVILEGFFVDSDDALDFDTAKKQEALGIAYAKGVLKHLNIPHRAKPSHADTVREKYGFDENTMAYLAAYRYADALMERLAER